MLKVSVIIPTYNRAELLAQALESVSAQTFQDYEIIVVDDGSEDETRQAIEETGIAVKYVRIEHSGLAAVARNKGIEIAQGQYIAFLDSDDQWLPEKLARQVQVLENNPNAGLVCSNTFVSDEGHVNAEKRKPLLDIGQGVSGRVFDALLKNNFIATSTVVIRREILETVGRFDESTNLHYSEDYDLWLRVAEQTEIAYLDEPLVIYARHVASLSQHLAGKPQWLCIKEVLTRRQLAHPERTAIIRKDLAGRARQLFRIALVAGDRTLARYFAGELIKLERWRPSWYGYWITSFFPSNATEYLYQRARFLVAQGRSIPPLRWLILRHLATKALRGQIELKLHLGCGNARFPGYLNIDLPPSLQTIMESRGADLYADIKKLELPEGAVAEVRLHHVFEHFDRATALKLLIRWYLWLKAGGRLVIETPDFMACARKITANEAPSEENLRLLRHIFGSHEAFWAYHLDGWYPEKFEYMLSALGFQHIRCISTEYKGLFNVTVHAEKLSPCRTKPELYHAAEQLLANQLVDDSEQDLLAVWKRQLHARR